VSARGPEAQHRIVILHGKDSFLRMEWSKRLRTALEVAYGGVDEFTFDGSTVSLATVLDELRSYGLMSSHKLVVVDNADAFFGAEDRRRAMERYAESPMKEATLLLRSQNWRPGNFDKAVAKHGIILKCESPSDADAARWCTARSEREHKIAMNLDAANLLVERVGADLARLDSEIGKLAVGALSCDRKQIDCATVIELVGAGREEQAWEIQDAILSGDPGRAASKLTELLRISKAPEVMVSWAVIDLARKIHAASTLVARGASDGQIAKDLRFWGNSTAPILRAARTMSVDRAANLLNQAIRADLNMKTGVAPDPERSLVGLCVVICEALARANLRIS